MEHYVNLREVRTWYAEHGEGDPLVMLHPGGVGVSSRAFEPNIASLASHFRLFLPERRGHGRTPDTTGPYSFELVAEDTIFFIEHVVRRPVRLLGVSDGSIVALHATKNRPDLVQQLVCVAGVFHNAGWYPQVIEPTEKPPDFLIESYAELSPDGKDHFHVVHRKLDEMHAAGPRFTTADLESISARTLVMLGDDDEMSLEHAIAFYRALRNGELAVIPGTSHGLLWEKPELCSSVIVDFLTQDPVETLAPIRRAL